MPQANTSLTVGTDSIVGPSLLFSYPALFLASRRLPFILNTGPRSSSSKDKRDCVFIPGHRTPWRARAFCASLRSRCAATASCEKRENDTLHFERIMRTPAKDPSKEILNKCILDIKPRETNMQVHVLSSRFSSKERARPDFAPPRFVWRSILRDKTCLQTRARAIVMHY